MSKPRTHTKYKVDGKFVVLPKKSKEEMKAHRREYNRKWRNENPDKVLANTLRHRAYKEKVRLGI